MSTMKRNPLAPLVTVCIPFSRNPYPDWSISLASIVPPMNATHKLRRTIGVKRDIAREMLAEQVIEDGGRFMLCLDDDVTVPPDIIRKLLFQFSNSDDDVAIVGGIYCTKAIPTIPLVFKDIGDGPFYRWSLGEVFECDVIATGALMADMDKVKNLPKPWFKDIDSTEDGKKYGMIPESFNVEHFGCTDDTFFCKRVKDAGYKILAHGGVLCMHWDDKGAGYILPMDSYPVKTEYVKLHGKEQPSEETLAGRMMNIYRKWYAYTDLLPIENDLYLNVGT